MLKKALALILCAMMLFAMIFTVSAQDNADESESLTEAQILDQMAQSWIDTCKANKEYCQDGLNVFALEKVFSKIGIDTDIISKEIIQQVYQPLKDGLVSGLEGNQNLLLEVDIEKFDKEMAKNGTQNLLKGLMTEYLSTLGADAFTEEWNRNKELSVEIRDLVKNGEIVDGVTVLDIIKENYVYLLGRESCTEALLYFELAKNATDLETKRINILIGASLATFGCEMSINETDKIAKSPYSHDQIKTDLQVQQEMMVNLVNDLTDVIGEFVPQIEIATGIVEITTDIGLKTLSMSGKLNALSGYMLAPETIESDKNGFYNAISNQYDRYTYEFIDFEVTMDEYKGYLHVGDDYNIVNVPEALFGFPVVAFDGTFADSLSITEITIPSTIESRAMANVVNNCDKLEKVYYNAINCKGWYLHYFFNNCNSDFEVIFGEGIVEIPEHFIANCGLTAIEFPEGVKVMHSDAVVDCPDLKTVTIPSTVETFDVSMTNSHGIVGNCENLETVYYKPVSPEAGYYHAILANCGNNVEEMVLVIDENVKMTPSRFLDNCGVKSVTFPEGMTQIREYAITDCEKLETITIPSTVTVFSQNFASDYVFTGCNNLKDIYYNAQHAVGEVGVVIFYDIHSNFEIHFGDQVEDIPQYFMKNCGLIEIEFPEGVKNIERYCLVDCDSLKTVTIPSTVEWIDICLVQECGGIETIYFNADYTTYATSALIYNSGNYEDLKMQVILGENVTAVPENFIENCAIREFVYPEGVKTIHKDSLVDCAALERVVFPSTVEYLNTYVVHNCNSLKIIEYNARNAARSTASYYGIIASSGHEDGLEIQFAENVETLPEYFMSSCTIRTLVLPDGFKKIPQRAVYACNELYSLTIPENVTTIDEEAFYQCKGLTEIKFNAVNMEDLESTQGAFSKAGEDAAGITVTIGPKVTRIPANLFCPSGSYHADPNIVKVIFAEGSVCTSIGQSAFAKCASLPEITIPASVTSIGAYAFRDCSNLTEITFCGDAPAFSNTAFYGIVSTAYYPDTYETWTEEVRQNYGGTITWVPIGNKHVHSYDTSNPTCSCGMIGYCGGEGDGNNLTWTYNNGYLTISGTGLMQNYVSGGAPWWNLRETITEVLLESDVSSIGDYAFDSCSLLAEITIPEGVGRMGSGAFASCSSLTKITFCGDAPAFADNVFGDVTATAYYFAGKASWTADVIQNYGGTITWVAEYVMLEGDGAVVNLDNAPELYLLIDGDISKFVDVTMDGEVVDPANYTATEGSTMITFTAEYLQTLEKGEHTVVVRFVDGVSTAMIMVEKQDRLLGDVNGDGKVSTTDYSRLLAHVKKVNLITDENALWAADVNGDGKITTTDYSRLLAHVKKVAPLW